MCELTIRLQMDGGSPDGVQRDADADPCVLIAKSGERFISPTPVARTVHLQLEPQKAAHPFLPRATNSSALRQQLSCVSELRRRGVMPEHKDRRRKPRISALMFSLMSEQRARALHNTVWNKCR